MFERIKAILSGESRIRSAYDETFHMMASVATLFKEASALLLDGQPPSLDIHKEDKRINEMEQSIRREILEHLSTRSETEVSASLILSAVVGYVERVGDYAKNIEELAVLYGRPLRECDVAADLVEVTDQICEYMEWAQRAFAEENKELALQVIKRHKKNQQICDRHVEAMFASKGAVKDDALVSALYARYLKRVSAGLKNVCTSVTAPFDHIGYSRIRPADD
ncbi:MAG: hypothetical protein GY856_07345 [bacterium]|nr:hypothetical protein [bacterium]